MPWFSLILLHPLVSLNHLSKVINLGSVTVRLEFDFLPDGRGETSRPVTSRPGVDHCLDGSFIYKFRIIGRVIDQS